MSDNLAQLSEPMTLMRTKDVKHLADRIEELEAKLAKAVEALERIDSIIVHSGGEMHGVTAQHWQTAFEAAQQEANLALAELTGGKDD